MEISQQIKVLRDKYKMNIPKDYEKFIINSSFFDYSGVLLNLNSLEIEINHFLKEDNENPSRDLSMWYFLTRENRFEYLTIAMGYGNEEIAIKVLGDNIGEVYYINQVENNQIDIKKIFNNFKDLENILTKEK